MPGPGMTLLELHQEMQLQLGEFFFFDLADPKEEIEETIDHLPDDRLNSTGPPAHQNLEMRHL